MSLPGPEKSKSNKVVAASAISSIALSASSSYLTNPFVNLYTAASSVVARVTSSVSDAFSAIRGKKRNAEEALQAVPSAEEVQYEAELAANIAAAEAHRDVVNAATNLASVPSPSNFTGAKSRKNKRHSAAESSRHIQLTALDSREGQRLYEGRKAMREAGKRTEGKRTDGEEPLKRFIARRGKPLSK